MNAIKRLLVSLGICVKVKFCADCRFHHHGFSNPEALCKRPLGRHANGRLGTARGPDAPINDFCRFQRQSISLRDWLNGVRPPVVGYCGPRAKYFEPRR